MNWVEFITHQLISFSYCHPHAFHMLHYPVSLFMYLSPMFILLFLTCYIQIELINFLSVSAFNHLFLFFLY